MKRQGQLVRWEAARGFGFIRSPDVPADVFVHLRDFVDPSLAPHVGMTLQFEEIHVGGKGPRAVAVQGLGATLRRGGSLPPRARRLKAKAQERMSPREGTSSPFSALPFILLSIGYVAILGYGVSLARVPMVALGILLLASFLTFFAYGFDKNAAETGRWRTKESTLHLLSLAGGWPGAWCAQRVFRHKVRKANFMAVYWATAMLHMATVAAWVLRFLPSGLTAL